MSILSFIHQTFAEPLPCKDKIGSNMETISTPLELPAKRETHKKLHTIILGNNWTEGHSKLHPKPSESLVEEKR